MIHDRSKIVFACLRAWLVALATFSVAFFASADSLSPYSVAQSIASGSPGVATHTLADVSPFDALISRPVSTSALEATANDGLTVRAAAKVQTNYGAVTATAARKVSWSGLVAPWKKVLKVVPFIGTGVAIYDLLDDLCIRPTSAGAYEQCYLGYSEKAPEMLYKLPDGSYTSRSGIEAYHKAQLSAAGFTAGQSCSTSGTQTNGNLVKTTVVCVAGWSSSPTYTTFRTSTSEATCDGGSSPVKSRTVPSGYFFYCEGTEITGYAPVSPESMDNQIDNYANSKPGRVPDIAPRLFDDLTKVPKNLPQDHQTVQPSGPTSITGPASQPGPSTTETTPDGQKVTTGGATITYNGDTSTVIHNTTTTYINNEGDVINETTTSEQAPSQCEVDPSSLACQELGDPGEGEIPKSDSNWSITPESLPGGFCPAGFVFPIPGSPSFSWQPICNNLPAARAVVILLSAVIAAWIVAGALKS